jgi:hypothetical protein
MGSGVGRCAKSASGPFFSECLVHLAVQKFLDLCVRLFHDLENDIQLEPHNPAKKAQKNCRFTLLLKALPIGLTEDIQTKGVYNSASDAIILSC